MEQMDQGHLENAYNMMLRVGQREKAQMLAEEIDKRRKQRMEMEMQFINAMKTPPLGPHASISVGSS